MDKPRIIALVAFIVIAVIASIALYYGITHHTEPTVTDSGQWSREDFPLQVHIQRYTAEGLIPDEIAVGVDAMEDVNRQLGFAAFIQAVSPEQAKVRLILGHPPEEGWDMRGGHFILRGEGGMFTDCDAFSSNVPEYPVHVRVLVHELGHCLGLVHDESEYSVMYPYQLDYAGTEDIPPPRITTDDRQALRALYR